MRGRGHSFPPGGYGRPPPPPPQQQPSPSPQHMNTDFSQQDPNLLLQNLANALLLNSLQQNFNVPFQNPIFPIQNPHGHGLPPPQQYSNSFPYQPPPQAQTLPPPNSNQVNQIPTEPTTSAQQQQKHKQPKYSKKPGLVSQGTREPLERIEQAVEKVHRDILAAGGNVSAWRVSKEVLLALQADSWESLGFRMQEVPPLHRLIVTEGKINAFINCFVAVRRIVSVYDLEVAICANEGVERFEELRLGPLIRHPLVLHYFSVDSDATKVFKITSEEVITELGKFLRKKRAIAVDNFLDLLAERRSVKRKETLGLRIQSLGMHITFLRDAVESELTTLKKCKRVLENFGDEIEKSSGHKDRMSKRSPGSSARISDHKCRKRPLFSSQKKDLDKRFVAVHKRVKSFYSTNNKFCGKHIRFVPSSSEDEESDDSVQVINMASNDVGGSVLSPQTAGSSDRVSTCPYPSATEERSRLGLKSEMSGQSSRTSGRSGLFGKKRKLEDGSWVVSMPSKLYSDGEGKNANTLLENGDKSGMIDTEAGENLLLCDDNITAFVTTWKSTCQEHTMSEVLEKMLQYYRPQQNRRTSGRIVKNMFGSSPFNDLFNVAVKSIKCGMWDSIYDTFQALGQLESTATLSPKNAEYGSIDVEPTEKLAPVVSGHGEQQPHGVMLEELMAKVANYYELDQSCQSTGKSCLEEKLLSLSKLCGCESWLANQFGVKDFKSLGYGEFFTFLMQHVSLIPTKLQKLLSGDLYGKSPLEVAMLQHQLVVLASQASNQQNAAISEKMISQLIARQFPLLSFKVMENGSIKDFLQAVEEHKDDVMSKCVLFSATLFGMQNTADSSSLEEDCILGTTEVKTSGHLKPTAFESVSSKNAVDVLLTAPMLSDLNLWSHWDLVFAPTLGPLVGWLLREVNVKDLLCIVTKDSSVIRIDPAASENSFLEAALQGSSFDAAVQLLSLFSVAGGEKHVPLSLLKCHACKAFEVFLENHSADIKAQDNRSYILHGKPFDGVAISNSCGGSATSVASRFVLDCIGYMPLEFHAFATDVLLAGMQSLIKEAPLAILNECNQKERLLLHEIGLSIGIFEWVNDYHAFYSAGSTDVMSSGHSCLETAASDCLGFRHVQSKLIFSDIQATKITPCENADTEKCLKVSCSSGGAIVSVNGSESDSIVKMTVINEDKDAAMVIESIRKEEFGLDPNLSSQESSMLKKQHARLGRALHCLSQELYSQDSHFVLELVQNADDNNYPVNEEPTLAFILQESGIVILNNELGFSAENIKALCDVGNSTKKGSDGGYIGKKGIGFKSVFRITDAPEIHSNGFHVKFDIGEGQIGFVLPTVIPPCNIDKFSRLVMREDDYMDSKSWNTCIMLPFRSKLSEETAMQMFSDLHPSLLLFLQRLQCIMFQNTLNDSPIVMRKEVMDDGIVKVSCGKDKMTWLVASQKLQAPVSRPKIQATEIAIAFTMEELGHGTYAPCLDQQPVFAFLPLRTYGLKFILQGDFVLTSSREEVDRNNPWNEWLLTKFPGLFVTAERSFCSLSCFKDNPGKAVAAYLSYVPLIGEVHGFFSGLPRAIILELRRSSCLLLEGNNSKLVPPCNAMRCWDEQARSLIPDDLLHEHLGLGFLDKNIVLSDSVAKALGIAEYGPEILVRFMACLCLRENGLNAMGMGWLSSWLNTLYRMISHSLGQIDLIDRLRSIPFIPLSDGSYSSLDVGAIWLQSDASRTGFDGALGFEAFPKLYGKIRTVNPVLVSASAVDETQADNIIRMLHIIGIQNLSAHEILKNHILRAICDDRTETMDKTLMTDYLCFIMIHLQSNCTCCCNERMQIISELQKKAYILTNYGYKRLVEIPIHFCKEFGNPVDVNRFTIDLNMQWHEVDSCYLKHPANGLLTNSVMKWREFLQGVGVTDFVQVTQAEKSVSDLSSTVLRSIIRNSDVIPPGSMVEDWESHELVSLLSLLSGSSNSECCKYLLEVLDTLWEDSFSDKAYCYLKSSGNDKPFRSSFMREICDLQWVVSSMDDKLHYPKDLFYSCDAVQSILGSSAPYALPKVRSTKLLNDIGFKTEVTINDALDVLEVWRQSEAPFKTSISQMSKFYSFIWGEMATSRNDIVKVLYSGPFIFVPCTSGSRHEVLVSGFFFSAEEVFWHDPTGSVNLMRKICPLRSWTRDIQCSISKTLCNIYPGLHDFFVNECGVCETPSCRVYLRMLHQLSSFALPSQAAGVVFRIFLRWTESHKSGLLNYEDIKHLRECLVKVEYTVLPTIRDKWVSLHPSFGLVCWCDDEKLKKIFKDLDDIYFLYFGSLNDDEQAILQTKVSILMETLGIPALSEVTSREAICHGQADCSLKASLINWALPYAQRYMHSMHRAKYFQLKQSGFDNLKQLQVVVVEKLFYKYVIKKSASAPMKQYKCNCLLQGNVLYTTAESDSHTLFLELSRLFFNDTPDLHMANFLHMITTMTESGSTKEQIEFFIVNSQKIPKLPDEEFVLSLSSMPPSMVKYQSIPIGATPMGMKEGKASNLKRKPGIGSNWPPLDWKTAPALDYAFSNLKTQGVVGYPGSPHETDEILKTQVALLHPNVKEDDSKEIITQAYSIVPNNMETSWTVEEHSAAFPSETGKMDSHLAYSGNQTTYMDASNDQGDLNVVADGPSSSSSAFSMRDQLFTGAPNSAQAMLTGKLGERVAFQYLTGKFGSEAVKWVNQDNETGLPYDIIIGKQESSREYIEVKATRSARKDWFKISTREWQFAVEKGEAFSICHVHFGNNLAQVTTFRNPVKLCQHGKLQLVVMMPNTPLH